MLIIEAFARATHITTHESIATWLYWYADERESSCVCPLAHTAHNHQYKTQAHIKKRRKKNEIYIVCMYKLNPNDELLCFMTTVDDGSRTAAAATAAITKSHICLH